MCLFELLECLLVTKVHYYRFLLCLTVLGLSATLSSALCFDHKKAGGMSKTIRKKKVKASEASPKSNVLMISKIQKALNKRMRGAVITYRRSGIKMAFEGAIRKAVKRFIK